MIGSAPGDASTASEAGIPRHKVRILLASDGSEEALAAGRFLAGILSHGIAQVHLVTVLSEGLYPHGSLGERLSDHDERHATIRDAEAAAFSALARLLRSKGHKVTTSHRFGHPPTEILAEVREWGPDLVVAGRRGLGRARRLVLGSVSERLLHQANLPVLIVP